MTETQIISPLSELRAEELPIVKVGFFRKWTSPKRSALLYLSALALAELITILVEPRAGMVMHGLVFVLLLLHSSLWARGGQQRFLLSLTLAPLIRLLSLSMPLPNYPFIYWYMVVGLPLFLASFVAARAGRMKPVMLGLTLRKWPVQILIGMSGVFLAFIEYLILKPKPLITEFRWDQVWLPALILLVFTGFLEEFIFRGMMQFSAVRDFGRQGIIYVAAVFAVLHFGYYSLPDVIFVFGVGVFFGWIVFKTSSIIGVTLAHGLTNIGLYLILPFLLTGPLGPLNFTLPLLSPHATSVPSATVTQSPAQTQSTISATPSATLTITYTPTVTDTVTPTATWTETPTLTVTSISSFTPTPLPASATPTVTLCSPPAGWIQYIVRAGDTLSSLSVKTGSSVPLIMQANCLSTNLLLVGQRLFLPITPAAPTASASPTTVHTKPSRTPTPTAFPSLVPSATSTLTPLPTVTPESTSTPEASATAIPTIEMPTPTPTFTPTPGEPFTPTPTFILTPTATPGSN